MDKKLLLAIILLSNLIYINGCYVGQLQLFLPSCVRIHSIQRHGLYSILRCYFDYPWMTAVTCYPRQKIRCFTPEKNVIMYSLILLK